jgi:hypothetical protein
MRPTQWFLAAAVAVSLLACTRTPDDPAGRPAATVQRVGGSAQARVTLTSEAARHLGVETDKARPGSRGRVLVPYAAMLYDPAGRTWVYTSPEPLVFVRDAIDVEVIRGSWALLTSGPPPGTSVVTVGASELLGVEYEVGEE